MGAIISLNCCIYWAVRRARMERGGEQCGGGGTGRRKEVEMKRIVPSMRKTAQLTAAYSGNRWNLRLRNKKLREDPIHL